MVTHILLVIQRGKLALKTAFQLNLMCQYNNCTATNWSFRLEKKTKQKKNTLCCSYTNICANHTKNQLEIMFKNYTSTVLIIFIFIRCPQNSTCHLPGPVCIQFMVI